MTTLRKAAQFFLVLGVASITAAAANAEPVEAFYKDRNVTLLISTNPGGGYDLYARTLARHIVNHIPGKPTIVQQYMPGAGGVKAANYVYNVAPRDGSLIALLSQAAALVQVLDGRGIKYNAADFNYIGRMVSTNAVVIVRSGAPAISFDDLKETSVAFATDGRGSQSHYNLALMRELLGVKAKLIEGYNGSARILHAMEQGEIDGYAYSWASLRARKPDWLTQKKVVLLAEIGLKGSAGLHVPLLKDLAMDEEHRKALELVAAPTAVGRSFLTPPGVPADRVAALRVAFGAAVASSALLDEAKRHNMEIDPMSGAGVQAIVERTVATPPTLIKKVREILD